MKLEKVYRNHLTGQELRSAVEKPDDLLILGCAHLQKFNEHGDVLEEYTSPNIVTDFVQDNIGRLVFNVLFLAGFATGSLNLGDSTPPGTATVSGGANALKMHNGFNTTPFSGPSTHLVYPFRYLLLTDYNVPESASELYVNGNIIANKGRGSNNPTLSTLSTDGRTVTLVYEWGLPDFSGTVYSVAWAFNNAPSGANMPAQGARTHIPGGITKTTSDALRVTYTFTYSGT